MLIWSQLVLVYGAGLSFFRPGCTQDEVKEAVVNLTEKASQPQQLIGATVISGAVVREIEDPDRVFCVYDTDADEFSCHADVIGRWPAAPSKNQLIKVRERRQKMLRDKLQADVIIAPTVDELMAALQARGFALVE